jgi:oligopeptide/dipeptide ABC transporter ATP-binding protein
MTAAPLLSVSDLKVSIAAADSVWTLVDNVSLQVGAGEVLGLVGESGSGKSLTLRAIARLLRPPLRCSGTVRWNGADLMTLPERQLNTIRGREIAMIFQEPSTALNPVLTVGEQIRESLRAHSGLDSEACRRRAIELLDHVGIPAARSRVDDYPHQFSGGMRQRAMIAIALAPSPKLLLADEPTTALDVTIQDQILKLILRLRTELGMSLLLVTHDLGVIAQTCDQVAVMYAGRVVEQAPVAELLREPRHAYTRGLLESLPMAGHARRPLRPIPGSPPGPDSRPAGCGFSQRCRFVTDDCRKTPPPLVDTGSGHLSACIHHDRLAMESRS